MYLIVYKLMFRAASFVHFSLKLLFQMQLYLCHYDTSDVLFWAAKVTSGFHIAFDVYFSRGTS